MLPFRPSFTAALLGLALVTPLPAVPEAAGLHVGSTAQHPRRGGRSKSIFGGAKVRLAPKAPKRTTDGKDLLRKVKELQTKTRARLLGQPTRSLELADEAQLRSWFLSCDRNGNGWVSFSEAEFSMRFSRGRFQIFDTDRDGRMTPEEFQQYYMDSIMASGRFTPPRQRESSGPPPERTPEQVRAAYDTDRDAALGVLELAQLLDDYEQAAADPEALLDALDASGDRRLTLDELGGLHAILYPERIEDVAPDEDLPGSVLELFGEVIPRLSEAGAPTSPPQVVGPVPSFLRLDIDRDGFISVADLETLMRPVRVGVRPHAVINTLDTDGDMRLSEQEFRAALIDLDD
jgi:EF hand domain-containing protein